MSMFKSILVVCAGNICRSPTAEYIFKKQLTEKSIAVSSAGLTALVDKSADSTAQKIASSHGVDMAIHHAQQLTSELVNFNDIILVMEQRQLDDLCGRYTQARGKTFLLGKWIGDKEIPDPYKKSEAAFIHVYEQIQNACDAWIKYL